MRDAFHLERERRERRGEFLKRGATEEMRDTRHDAARPPQRCIQRHLVDVLDENIERLRRQMPAVVGPRLERKSLADAGAMHVDAAERRARRAVGPSAAQHRDVVAAPREALEDLVQVDFRPASERILPILPVDDQQAH